MERHSLRCAYKEKKITFIFVVLIIHQDFDQLNFPLLQKRIFIFSIIYIYISLNCFHAQKI
jgi:hypothetical protein